MKSIELNSLKNFKCIGGDCPQTCCRGFKIGIDAETREKWSALKNVVGDGTLDENLELFEQNGQAQYVLKSSDESRCSLLDKEQWCVAQKQYGHEALPETCRQYPRSWLNNDAVKITTATLSCPEVLDQVLFKQDKLDFNVDLNKLFTLDQPAIAHQTSKLRFLLAEFVSKVLQLNKTPLNIKLFYIAHCVGAVNENIGSTSFNEANIKAILSKPKDAIFQITRDIKQKKIQIDQVTAGSYWKNIASLFVSQNVKLESINLSDSPLMRLCAQDISAMTAQNESFNHFREIYTMIQDYKNNWQAQRPDKFKSLLERYIITSFINKGFPLHPKDGQFAATLVFVMTAACAIQLALWIAYKESDNQDISNEQLQQIFYQIESRVGHTDTIYQTLSSDPHMVQINRYAQVFLDLFV